jgi:hypothetical protein
VLEAMRDKKFRKGAGSLEVQSEDWPGTESGKMTKRDVMSAWGVAMNVSAEDQEEEAEEEEEQDGDGGDDGDGDKGDGDKEDDEESHHVRKWQPGSCSLSKKP